VEKKVREENLTSHFIVALTASKKWSLPLSPRHTSAGDSSLFLIEERIYLLKFFVVPSTSVVCHRLWRLSIVFVISFEFL
jgi:hypothetical protein